MTMVKSNARLLSLFSEADGFKFLTHGFDESDSDFVLYLANCRTVLLDYKGVIEESLYRLLFGFMYGPSWKDYNGLEHSFSCSNPVCIDWCLAHPNMHPKDTEEFAHDFEAFRRSIRIYQMDLEKYVKRLFEEAYPEFIPAFIALRRANVYVNVNKLMSIIKMILSTMRDERFRGNREIRISYEKCAPMEGYMVSRIIIQQMGSTAEDTSIASLCGRVQNGGGDFGSIKSLVEGTCYWSVESQWIEGPGRLEIVSLDNSTPYYVMMPEETIHGFTHVLTLIHNTL